MRKKKIYLETSTVSHLRQEDAPEKMKQTQEFWEILKTGKYDVYTSDITVIELSRCAEPKRKELLALLEDIGYTLVEAIDNEEIAVLEEEVRRLGIIPAKKVFDRLHIAAAVYSGCNIIVSWNFDHMVNVKTIDGVRIICLANNIAPVDIYSADVLLERSVSDE
jgi:predicted nucleic acid-binding protein